MADAPSKKTELSDDERDERLVKLIVAAIQAANAPKPPGTKRPKRELAPEHQGTKTYIVGPSKHWRGNRLYQQGELVTVTNERPARDWVLAPGQEAKAAPKPPALPAKRANDVDVG